jgi:O-antigen ligase
MWKTGLQRLKITISGNQLMNVMQNIVVKRDPSLSGALDHMRGHLHNEVVETLSVKRTFWC